MGLFDNLKPKNEEKNDLFSTKKESENDGRGTTAGGTETGGTNDRLTNRSSGGNTGGTAGGNEGAGLFQFSSADDDNANGNSKLGNIGKHSGTDNDTDAGNDTEDSQESTTEKQISGRPSFLNKKTEIQLEKAKDIKIEKRGDSKRKKGEFLDEEQVEILISSLFDAVALFRGNHWKLQKDELTVVPSLARIVNRMLAILPKGMGQNAFQIMDYVIVIGCFATLIMKRLSYEKGVVANVNIQQEQKAEPSRNRGTAEGTVYVPHGNENSLRGIDHSGNGNSVADERGKTGVSFLAPIEDLAPSINTIR